MTTELATMDLGLTPFTWKTLTTIADTEMVPRGLRGNPPAMLAAIYLGREIGLGPMQSMQMIDVIDGRPSLSAELQTAMIRAAGHSITASEFTASGVTVLGRREDNGDEMPVSFTWDMAKRAGLTEKRNWRRYPEAMLWARAVSMLARMLFADVFAVAHVYTPDELGDTSYVPNPDAVGTLEPLPVDSDTGATPDPPDSTPAKAPTATKTDMDTAVDLLEAELDALPVEDLEIGMVQVLAEVPTQGTIPELEDRLRRMCRLAERLELVHPRRGMKDWLHTVLAERGAAHVSELKRAELERVLESLQHDIGAKYSEYWNSTNETDAP